MRQCLRFRPMTRNNGNCIGLLMRRTCTHSSQQVKRARMKRSSSNDRDTFEAALATIRYPRNGNFGTSSRTVEDFDTWRPPCHGT
jgi:hypothetical protein